MFTLICEGAIGISQIKMRMMNARAEERVQKRENKVREPHSGVHRIASIPGLNPGLPLTFLITLGKSLNFCASISLF